ncbi:methionyl-tRNA formyltransferase [Ktedonosporobacter rubrisoli]|uniref:methionyl-tRNA formyltransferase n=1 Tax=Ktedonosporobacter rubrisoli TaxID=2509675 RepID=A0A4P6JSW1_KTERU|nr:methionyl-tRNA formyltransferase [Ktedonosporobacter rubrisoli]QBD77966.1 methionyl-tRNA formyltransferase [Ktedonosporobacter rubrisoli]
MFDPGGGSPRVIFFGMQGPFSLPSLVALLEAGIEVCAVVVPATPLPGTRQPAIQLREPPGVTRAALPLLNSSLQTSIVQLAWKRHIPVWEVQRLTSKETISQLTTYRPDMICVACFSLLIPPAILHLPRLGCLNVHPSLLPVNRGPVPIFWTFHEGHTTTGVTIHFMNKEMDRGDILAQEAITIPEGISYAALEELCANHGASLLARTVADLYAGRAMRTPQDETKSSYYSFPAEEDLLVVAEHWEVRQAYNFMCGVADWMGPIVLRAGEENFSVRKAISYSHGTMEQLDEAGQHERVVRCKDGWLHVKLNPA